MQLQTTEALLEALVDPPDHLLPLRAAVAREVGNFEHTFATAQGSPLTRFNRALNAKNVLLAEFALGELETVPLEVALQLVHLYAHTCDGKFEPAARKWLLRFIAEQQPSVETIAATACTLYEASQRYHAT